MRKIRLIIVIFFLSSLCSCWERKKEISILENNLFCPKSNLKPFDILKLNLNKVPEDVPLFEHSVGDIKIIIELTSDYSKLVAQYWEMDFLHRNDSIIGLESFLQKNKINLFVVNRRLSSLYQRNPIVAHCNDFNTLYSCTFIESAPDSVRITLVYYFPIKP